MVVQAVLPTPALINLDDLEMRLRTLVRAVLHAECLTHFL